MATIEHPRPEGLLHNTGFSQVVVANGRRIVHTAGQVAIDERGALVGVAALALPEWRIEIEVIAVVD